MERPRLAIAVCALVALTAVTARGQQADAPDGGASAGEAADPPDLAGSGAPAARALSGCVLQARLQGVVNHGTADYLADAVDVAEDGPCQMLLVVLDTPGGMLDATRVIVRELLGADVPVAVWVGPGGARAGSAGVFITMAAHVAAMAPGTNIGAAHPVSGTGKDPESAGGEHMAEKVVNDTAALARTIAQKRGRNVEWAEKAVRQSVSATAREARDERVVDLVVGSERALLDRIDGRVIELDLEPVRPSTAEAPIREHAMSMQQRALAILGHPNVAYVLFMIGVLGIMIEIYNPGMIAPGAVGAFALLLAAIGLNALPVNIGGMVLLAVAVVLFVAELNVTSYGLLTFGGLAALLVGSALLIDESDPTFFAEPSVELSWGAVLPLAFIVTGAVAGFAWRATRLRKRPSPTGREGLLGELGRTAGEVGPSGGRLRIHGETWEATSERPLPAGTKVEVVAVEGLQLRVRPAAATSPPTPRTRAQEDA